MKKFAFILMACAACFSLAACSDDEEKQHVKPDGAGSFVDVRDGVEYHYVRYGNLEWTCENAHYIIGDETLSTVYQGSEVSNNDYSMANWEKYGCLYSQKGAKMAVPDGWRLPTDEDWQNLERHLGMPASDASALEWRGNTAQEMIAWEEDQLTLRLQLGGYYTQHTLMMTSGYRFMSAYGFYWTSTADESKTGEYYFYRKVVYNRNEVYRQSMEPDMQMLAVRFCRDVQ